MQEGKLSFGAALAVLRHGGRVARSGWNGKGMYIQLQVPDANSKMRQPYIYIVPSEEDVIPWVPSQRDILSEDWYEVTI